MLNAHNVLQLGWQSAFGTANAIATRKLQNVSSFKLRPELETRALDQLRGTMAPTHQTVLDRYLSSASAETSDTDFEELNYWLEMLFGTVAPTGSADPYTRVYAAPTTTAVTPHFATLQFGQTGEVWQMQDASVTSLTLSGASNSGVSVGASLMGGLVKEGTLATLPDLTTGTRMTGCMASVAIETWDGSSFAPLASSAFSWELSVNANREYHNFLGECTPTASYDNKWSGQLKLSLELNTSTDDYLIAMLADANTILQKRVRIIYTVGTSTALRSMTIDFAGHTMQAPELFQDKNGLMTYDLVLDGVYNPTASQWLSIETEAALATV
ncbi:MAG: hypothetical protein RBT66_01140 [bacterium]|jgi:hypothetical protein|nr:hypothetical protein [bacterium]